MAKKKLTLPKLKAKLQPIFNKYIRLRDNHGNGTFTCIACGITKSTDVMNAGHYYAVKGYDSLRFNEDNVHGECAGCNCWDESHLIGYGTRLSAKIGENALQALHQQAMEYKKGYFKWSRLELEELIVTYRLKIKEVE
jgi:hypothetical protein